MESLLWFSCLNNSKYAIDIIVMCCSIRILFLRFAQANHPRRNPNSLCVPIGNLNFPSNSMIFTCLSLIVILSLLLIHAIIYKRLIHSTRSAQIEWKMAQFTRTWIRCVRCKWVGLLLCAQCSCLKVIAKSDIPYLCEQNHNPHKLRVDTLHTHLIKKFNTFYACGAWCMKYDVWIKLFWPVVAYVYVCDSFIALTTLFVFPAYQMLIIAKDAFFFHPALALSYPRLNVFHCNVI